MGYSIVLNQLFRYTLRFSNLGMYIDQWSLEFQISNYYYYFIAYLSVAYGFCFTTYLWMSKPFATHARKTIRLRMGQINPIWILFATLLFFLRIFWFFSGLELTVAKDIPLLGLLLPLFIYLFCWNLIADVYTSLKAMWITTSVVFFLGFILSVI